MPRESQRDRIAADLRQRIADGEFLPGAKLPSTRALRTYYSEALPAPNLGQNAVQAAVERLKWEGLLVGKQGIGVFVAGGDES